VVVRGLDRYLELKDLAKKLEEEKREREENAFKVRNISSNNTLPFTIPSPFHFHTRDRIAQGNKQIKREDLNKEMRQKEEAELTFKPHTNVAYRAKRIERILNM
jgi:chromatin segregation and condensation protein Rec8/ScpA/Scc1 (kleisin family)